MSNPGDPKNPQQPSGNQPPQGYPQQGFPQQGQPPSGFPQGQNPGGVPGQGGQNYQQPYQTPGGQTYAAPPYGHPHNGGDSTGGIIPYKNPKALIGYYCAIAGGIPVLGFPFAIAGLVLGIMGLRDRAKNPVIKGSVHAWIGIVGGSFGLLLNLCIIISIIAAISGAGAESNRGKFTMPSSLAPTRSLTNSAIYSR